MPDRLLGVLWHEAFELRLGVLMLEMGLACAPKYAGEFGPGIGRIHVDDPHRLNASSRWLDAEEARALAALDAAPEFLFRRQKKVLIERISWYLDFDPLAAAGDDRQDCGGGIGDPHVVLELGHVLLRRRLLRERPRQHEFGFEYGAGAFDDAVQRGSHPADHRMAHPALDIFDHLPGRPLVPLSVQVFSREPQLDDEIAGEVLRLGLAPFFAPEAEQSGLIAAHDDPDVRASNKVAAVNGMPSFRGIIKHCVLRGFAYRSRGWWPSGSGLAVRMELEAEFRFRVPTPVADDPQPREAVTTRWYIVHVH